MSASGPKLAPPPPAEALPKDRSPFAHLLHALNQPLTGLQCSLELAAAGPRRPEQYSRTIRESLELTLRMRVLVEALRELADLEHTDLDRGQAFALDQLLGETAEELQPVAETLHVKLATRYDTPLSVQADRRALAALTFRFLESVLSLAGEGTELLIAATRGEGQGALTVCWIDGPPPEHSPFSRPELGLLIAQAGWERAGAQWERQRAAGGQSCTIRLPLARSGEVSQDAKAENLR